MTQIESNNDLGAILSLERTLLNAADLTVSETRNSVLDVVKSGKDGVSIKKDPKSGEYLPTF